MKKIVFALMFSAISFSLFATKTMTIKRASSPIVVDGAIGSAEGWPNDWVVMDQVKGTTSDMAAKFQIVYDNNSLYVVVQVNDGTPTNDTTAIPNTWERDCVEMFISLDTTSGDGRYKAGAWQIRKQRYAGTNRGEDGGYGKAGGTVLGNISPLISDANFKCVSTGQGSPYIIEYALPWKTLGAEMETPWEGMQFKFDIVAADNTTGFASGRTQQNFWNSNSDSQWNNTNYFGLIKLESTVGKTPQTIVFSTIPALAAGGDPYIPVATASTGLPISYTSSDTTVAYIMDGKIYAIGAGTCSIKAVQLGNSDYAFASVAQVITIAKGVQKLSLIEQNGFVYGSPDFAYVTSNSNIPILLSTSNPNIAFPVGGKFRIANAGSVTIKAWQVESKNYYASDTISKIITINKAQLIAKVGNYTKEQGQPNPEFVIKYNGFIGSDNDKSLESLPTTICEANNESPIGDYEIAVIGGTAKNYLITGENGKLVVEKASSINESVSGNIEVYPNPSADFIYFSNLKQDNVQVDIYNLQGTLVMKSKIIDNNVNISTLKSGSYICKINDAQNIISISFIKK